MLTDTTPGAQPQAASRPGGTALRTLVHAESFGAGAATVTAFVVFSVWAPHFLTAQSLASAVQVAAELGGSLPLR